MPEAVDRYTRANAAQGETRNHGFFYKAESEHNGLLGLPIIGGRQSASRQLRHESASLLYLRNRGLSFGELGGTYVPITRARVRQVSDPESAAANGAPALTSPCIGEYCMPIQGVNNWVQDEL
jgi:hypothetical protein